MIKPLLSSLFIFFISFSLIAQNNVGIGISTPAEKLHVQGNVKGDQLMLGGNRYNLVSYNMNGTPTNGVKILTNIPYQNSSQMPSIVIEGYNYGGSQPINLSIVWYIYNGSFVNYRISSFGAYTPEVQLGNENGKVVIFINDKQYYNRFTVRAYANGMSENDSWFKGWTVVDQPLNGTNVVTVPYENRFSGNVFLPGSGIWNSTGNVGIKTTAPTQALDINGNLRIRAGSGTVGRVLKSVSTDGTVGWGEITFTELTGVPATFPPSAGSGNYIQNQYSTNQSANYRISGNGAVIGNLGVGTASPAHKLDVTGNIRSVGGTLIAELASNEGGNLALVNPSKTGATTRDWRLWNMTGGYGNGLSFWRYYADGTNAGPAVWFGDNGLVGIGTTNPSYTLHVNGRIKSNGITESSDERLKDDIETLQDALDIVLQMRGVKYSWKEEAGEGRFKEGTQVGLIAQEVEKVLPEVVDTDQEGYKSIQYSVLVALLIEAIKEQEKEIKNLDTEVSLLNTYKSDNDERIKNLEEQMKILTQILNAETSK